MGRPLNKKYFGNRNIGTTGTADNGIGGEGVASISTATVGSFVVNDTYRNFPLLNIAAPTLPSGVQATADVVFEIDTVTYTSGGQTDADYVAGLSTEITGLGGGAIVYITEVASKVTAVDVTTEGTNRGEFRRGDIVGTGITSHQVLQAPNAGTDLQITVTYRLKSITILEKGSGYVSAPQLSWSGHTFTGQTTPSAQTPTLTTDTGAVGSATNQENAIVMYANVSGSGTTASVVDIIKQVSTTRYKVTDGTDTAIIQLNHDTTPDSGYGYIVATDANGSTYYVDKLTAHRAVLTQKTMVGSYVYASGASAPWTFAAAAGNVVQIENA